MVRYPPVSKAPPPSVDTAIVRYMTTMFRFSESDVIHSVTDRKLNASSATYHLLKRNMERQKLSSSEGSLGAGDDACAEDTSSRNSDRLTSARTSQSLGGSVRTVSDYSSSDTKECRTSGKNGEAQDVNNYKQCILYLKEARHGMFMNGRAFTKLRRDNVVGAVAASLDHNQYDEVRVGSHKLPFLNQHKGLHSFGQQLSQGQTSVSQLPTQTLTQFPHPHPHGGEVTRHLVQPASSQDVRLNVFGKSALKSQGQGQGGRQGDRSGSVAVNGNTTLYWSQPPPPPPPPNTAHGRRSSRHQIALSDPGPHSPRSYGTLTPPSLKDPFGRDTWRTVYQQEVRVAGENEARQQRTPGVAFVAPLSSPKALTSRQTESGGEKKQSYFLVRRLAADLSKS
nr:hypothetical protein BaRGS_004809 [Batillaria attramentaria]